MLRLLAPCLLALSLLLPGLAGAQPKPPPPQVLYSLPGNWTAPQTIMPGALWQYGKYATVGPYGSVGVSNPYATLRSTTRYSYFDNNEFVQNPSKLYWGNPPVKNITCSFVNGSPVVTACSNLTGAITTNFLEEQTDLNGNPVVSFGTTFPAGTTILSGLTSTGFTMSANATGTTGAHTISVVKQCGNAADVYVGQTNGLIGDGSTQFAVGASSPSNGCQGFFSQTRMGAAAHTIYTGAAYDEVSYLGAANAYAYFDRVSVITHGPNADYYPAASWNWQRVDGQTGDIRWFDHLAQPMLYMQESNHTLSVFGELIVQQPAQNTLAAYIENYDATRSIILGSDTNKFPFLSGFNGTPEYFSLEGYFQTEFAPANYATCGGVRITVTFAASSCTGFGLDVSDAPATGTGGARGGARIAGNIVNPSAVVTTPSNGGTVTFAATQARAIIDPAGTLATLTVTLPACTAAMDGDERAFSTSQIITSLTVGTAGGSVISGATSAAVGSGHTYHCVGATTKWYQVN